MSDILEFRSCNSSFCGLLRELQKRHFTATDEHNALFHDMWQSLASKDPRKLHYIQIKTYKDLAESFDCPSCRFIWQTIQDCSRGLAHIHPSSMIFVRQVQHEHDTSMEFVIVSTHLDVMGNQVQGWAPYLTENGQEPITFLADTDNANSTTGRAVDCLRPDLERAKSWLALCDAEHADTCRKQPPDSSMMNLRVYDLINDCLCEIEWQQHYAALSYVWGHSNPPRLTKDKVTLWKQRSSLRDLRRSFPATIRDTMEVAQSLGLVYFWFDSLCLIQDDEEDLRRSIDNMDVIYGHAHLTIIAADSTDANEGLPGLSVKRNPQQKTQQVTSELTLVRKTLMAAHINRTEWEQRGWTLQEQLLSTRTLMFLGHRMFFQCRTSLWGEDCWTERSPHSKPGTWRREPVPVFEQKEQILSFASIADLCYLIENYSIRNLRYQSDGIRAFQGIFRRYLSDPAQNVIYGLYKPVLPISILFEFVKGSPRLEWRRRHQFPSYSWAGWKDSSSWGHLLEDLNIYDHPRGSATTLDYDIAAKWLERANWIQWVEYSLQTGFRDVWRPSRYPEIPLLSRMLETIGLEIPPTSQKTDVEMKSMLLTTNINYSILVFSTIIVRLYVTSPDFSSIPRVQAVRAILQDASGRGCGEVTVDVPLKHDNRTEMDCLILTQRWRSQDLESMSGYEIDPMAALADKRFDRLWPKHDDFYVMLVTQIDDSGLYERRGSGVITFAGITNSLQPGPRWQRIYLA